MVAVASGMVRRADVRALARVMCAAIRRRAPALACGESRATTLAAARPVRVHRPCLSTHVIRCGS